MRSTKQANLNPERLLPSDVGQTHPRISVALSLRLYNLLDLLEWVEEHPAHIEPRFIRKLYPKDKVKHELTVLLDQFGESTQMLKDLNRVLYYAALYLVENAGDHEEDQGTLYTLETVIQFFERIYKMQVI